VHNKLSIVSSLYEMFRTVIKHFKDISW